MLLMLLFLSLFLLCPTNSSYLGCMVYVQLHRYYRSSGHSIERVQNEAGTALAKNEGVRSAVVTGVKATF